MAFIELQEQPRKFQSAYKPITWGLDSQRYPINNMPNEGVWVIQIKVADATDVASYGDPLRIGDVMVLHSNVTAAPWWVGVTVTIAGNSVNAYNGTHRVRYTLADYLTVIDAAPSGWGTSGTITRAYENYRLVAYVLMENDTRPDGERVVIEADPDGRFRLDVSRIARPFFKDVFNVAGPSPTLSGISGSGFVTQSYTIYVNDSWLEPDVNGNLFFYENNKDQPITASGVAVNSVQPYHYVDETGGSPKLLWEDDLEEYVVKWNELSTTKRFLTFAPSGSVRIAPDECHYLGILWHSIERPMWMHIVSLDAQGVELLDEIVDVTVYGDSTLLPVGRDLLDPFIDPAAAFYEVYLEEIEFEKQVTGRYRFAIENSCAPMATRIYALNEFGAIDSYTMEGKQSRDTNVRRHVAYREDMPGDLVTAGRNGSTQRRAYDIDIERHYTASSRTEGKEYLRYLSDCFFESPDLRVCIYRRSTGDAWTSLIITNDNLKLGASAGRMNISYSLGVDNQKQRR